MCRASRSIPPGFLGPVLRFGSFACSFRAPIFAARRALRLFLFWKSSGLRSLMIGVATLTILVWLCTFAVQVA